MNTRCRLAAAAAALTLSLLSHTLHADTPKVGDPLQIKFQAVNGSQVDLEALKGKVVLVDFWATWCPPCVREVPHLREAYKKLHEKGFEIVGISLDQDKARLNSFTKQQGMTWPQYFDGKGWDNEISSRFGVQSIPQMWLLDKKGRIADLNGRQNLVDKVEKLLAQ